jgi:hypothetical protein
MFSQRVPLHSLYSHHVQCGEHMDNSDATSIAARAYRSAIAASECVLSTHQGVKSALLVVLICMSTLVTYNPSARHLAP